MICDNCKKEIVGQPVKSEPSRHACSPNSINWLAKKKEDKYYWNFCSKDCQKSLQDITYAFWANQDRNASDSECFETIGVEKDRLNRTIRTGKCKITGMDVKVEPLQVGDNSGQPIECYQHFVLREKYQKILEKL